MNLGGIAWHDFRKPEPGDKEGGALGATNHTHGARFQDHLSCSNVEALEVFDSGERRELDCLPPGAASKHCAARCHDRSNLRGW